MKGFPTQAFTCFPGQCQYANNKNIPYVVMAGENEMKEGKVTLKDMKTGEQKLITNEGLEIIMKSE